LNITFLGTGTSQGVPVIGCTCDVCRSQDPKDRRLRTSLFIQHDGKNIVVDTGPDFRQQMLTAEISQLDAVVFTHQHRDHIAGLDDVRSFNFLQKKPMPVYGNAYVMDQIRREFHYVFDSKYPGVPQLLLHEIRNEPFDILGLHWIPVEVMHHQLPVFGFRIDGLTYITDANYIPKVEMKKLEGSHTIIINALQREDHISHFTLSEALEIIRKLNPERAYLTHISHNLGFYDQVSSELPGNIFLAYDGLQIVV
jgi:phosphoribosyl 1,2-cyclic phosphate phosphodiesterase